MLIIATKAEVNTLLDIAIAIHCKFPRASDCDLSNYIKQQAVYVKMKQIQLSLICINVSLLMVLDRLITTDLAPRDHSDTRWSRALPVCCSLGSTVADGDLPRPLRCPRP